MLEQCIEKILTGPWHFIQLRGEPLSEGDVDRGDVDFLGNPESIGALLAATYEWVAAGLCHVHISARKFGKKALVLYTPDGKHRLILDLWYALPQLQGTSAALVYDAIDTAALISSEGCSIFRFSMEVEASIYLHHLAAKKKDLSQPHTIERLQGYRSACQRDVVVRGLNRVVEQQRVDDVTLSETLEIIGGVVDFSGVTLKNDCTKRLRQRGGGFLCIMGCDGVGKTSLANALAASVSPEAKSFRGKRLYRRSLMYKLMVKLLRRKFPMREQFDEFFVFFVYLRACFGLRAKQLFARSQLYFIDRNLVDFLFVNRKTDHPQWSSVYPLHSMFGKRIPTVHCIADFETVSARKQEMTAQGHACYDRMMFEHFSGRNPTDYTLFNNGGELDASRDALLNILLADEYPLSARFKVRKDRS
jgi:hypothetical protein